MANIDLNNLRSWLDEQENFVLSIKHDNRRMEIAQEMLAIIADARRQLFPSTDSTANYVPNKRIIEDLVRLREQAEHLGKP